LTFPGNFLNRQFLKCRQDRQIVNYRLQPFSPQCHLHKRFEIIGSFNELFDNLIFKLFQAVARAVELNDNFVKIKKEKEALRAAKAAEKAIREGRPVRKPLYNPPGGPRAGPSQPRGGQPPRPASADVLSTSQLAQIPRVERPTTAGAAGARGRGAGGIPRGPVNKPNHLSKFFFQFS
jgi:hypothetical protein